MIELLIALIIVSVFPLPYEIQQAPRLRSAPVTLGLVIVNFLIYLGTDLSPHGFIEPTALFQAYGLTPADIHVVDLVTYMFLHIGGAHVLWNMVVLYLFGVPVEERVGSVLFAALYLLCGVAAGLLDVAMVMHFAPNTSGAQEPLVGASGAISGVVGLFTVFGGGRALKLFWGMGRLFGPQWLILEIPAGIGVAIWLVVTIYGAVAMLHNTTGDGMAYFAHLGGFAFGVVCGLIGGLTHKSRRRAEPATQSDNFSSRPSPQTSRGITGPAPSADGVVDLLRRSIEERDYPRATALYAKCRGLGSRIPAELVERLTALAAEVGETA